METRQVCSAFIFNESRTGVKLFLNEGIGEAYALQARNRLSSATGIPAVLHYDAENRQFCIEASVPEVGSSPLKGTSMTNIENTLEEHHEVSQTTEEASASDSDNQPHIPRPPNSWILYRQHHSRLITALNPKRTAGEISTVVSQMWRSETEDVKNEWRERAAEEARRHKELYPDYKYRARKHSKKHSSKEVPSEEETLYQVIKDSNEEALTAFLGSAHLPLN